MTKITERVFIKPYCNSADMFLCDEVSHFFCSLPPNTLEEAAEWPNLEPDPELPFSSLYSKHTFINTVKYRRPHTALSELISLAKEHFMALAFPQQKDI